MKLRAALVVVVVPVIAASCGSKKSLSKSSPVSAAVQQAAKDIPEGLDLKLSDGKQGAAAYDRTKVAAAKKLGDADVTALLARANPLPVDPGDQVAFALRPASQPAPRPGETIKESFPPPPSSLLPPAASDAGKDLSVLRWMPEGEVPMAPELSITFNEPMVPVTSQEDAATNVPVKLVPQPKGKWRWIGAKTILFDPDPRFPMATTYKVEVPAGTKSLSGGMLAKAHTFSFETPPIKMIEMYPSGSAPQKLDVPIFMEFDQKIDAKALLGKIVVKVPAQSANGSDPWATGGSTPSVPVAIQMLDDKEIQKDHRIKSLVEGAKKAEHDGRWIAFRPAQKLPVDSTISVEIPVGTPSAEGPNVTKEAQSFSFQTYPPLEVVKSRCGYDEKCRPGMALQFEMNNPLDVEKFDEQQVTVEPAIDGAHIIAQGDYINVYGATKAMTTYKVTLSPSLLDEFGQTLGKPETRTFDVGEAQPTFYGPDGIVVLDPAAINHTLDFFSTNYESLKVQIYKVDIGDLPAYGKFVQNQWNQDHPAPPPGTKVFDQLVKTKVAPNELVETGVDLTPALSKDGFGHALVIVEPSPWHESYRAPRRIAWVQSTKLAVDAHVDSDNLIGFVTELDGGKPARGVQLEMRPTGATATSDAQGLATIPLGAQSRGTYLLLAKRGNDVAFVSEDPYFNDYGNWYKQSRSSSLTWYVADDRKLYKPGEDVSLKGWLRVVNYGKEGDVEGLGGAVTAVSYRVIDSRGNEIAKGDAPVSTVGGWDAKFTLPTTPNLGNARVELRAVGTLSGGTSHMVRVEEFRRPEFEVSASAGAGPFVVGGGGDVTVSAKYFAGGGLPGADVNWYVTAFPTSFTPPNRDDYVFGNWAPWWGYQDWREDGGEPVSHRDRAPESYTHEGKTDAMGEHVLHMDFLSVKPSMPMNVTASASVQDVNRQTWSASTSIVVHPSSLYAGLKTKRSFVEKGKPFDVDVIAVDIDGKMVPGAKVEVKTVRLDWEYKAGRYKTKEVDPQTCNVIAKADASPCSFATKQGGEYQMLATVVDDKGRANQTKMMFWVSGGDNRVPSREVAQQEVQLIPDKKEYTPGNTAEIMVQSPFFPAEGLVTWRRSGIVKTERISLTTSSSASIKVPIVDAMTPNVFVQVDLVGMAERANDKGEPDPKLPKRAAYATGLIDLRIPPKQRTLAVTATPAAAKVSPGEATTIAIEVKDAAGKPLADAEAAVIVVDESVLSLTGYKHPDPIDSFYPERDTGAQDYYERAYVKLANPQKTAAPTTGNGWGTIGTGRYGTIGHGAGTGAGYGVGGGRGDVDDEPPPPEEEDADGIDETGGTGTAMTLDEGKMGKKDSDRAEGQYKMKKEAEDPQLARQEAIEQARNAGILGSTVLLNGTPTTPQPKVMIRTNFNALAAFSPSVKTGTDGKATVQVKIPDNLTRYRVVAIVAAGDKQFGKGESSITARLPLMVRPSPPRFLNFGDTFKLPIVVQNQTDAPMTVRVAARASNAAFTDGAGREVMVPPNDRVEVELPAKTDLAGTARFQIVGAAGNASDAANVELPVWTPATTEAFATYGVIDNGAIAQQVALPGKVWPQFGGLEVTTASTNMQALTDAVIYLVHYPFECAEQRSSRIMAIATLRDVLTAFHTKDLPSVASMESSIDVDIKHLSQMQNQDGGYAFWERGYPSEPYLSVFVTQALLKARAKNFTVNGDMINRSQRYLRDIEYYYPDYWPDDVRISTSAYALYVRKQMGDLDLAKAKKLFADNGGPDKLSMEANGWLLGVMAGNPAAAKERAAIMRYALNHVSETAGAANFTVGYGDGAYLMLASDRRVDGVMLESLIQEQKNSDLIPKLVTGLMAHRKRGHWLNTQENAFVLMALDLYFRTYEKTTPNFVARVWLGSDYAGDHTFKGRTTEYSEIDVPMKELLTHAPGAGQPTLAPAQDLTIQKDGAGRLYYRIGMKYAPEDLKVGPADYGFAVQRRYEGADDPKDVTRDKDGVWHIKAGTRVRVHLDMVNENRRYHVALVDPMPAGLEAINPELATTGPLPKSPAQQQSRGKYWWWYGPWYEHQNMRDERVEAFTSLLWEGNHTYEYIARATTPGNFVVPPPKAEEMYMPETFGRGGSDRVIVE